MSKEYPDREYGDAEVGYKDELGKGLAGGSSKKRGRYVGKHYLQKEASEVLAMGLEALFADPQHFAENDPEYFRLVIGALKGEFLK